MSRKQTHTTQPKSYAWVLSLCLGLCIFTGSGCDQTENVKKISMEQSERLHPNLATTDKEKILQIAVSAMVSPKETFNFYQQILTYLSQKTAIPVQLVQRETYKEVNTLLKENKLDMAFICSGAYVNGHDDFGMELLVVPVAYGKPVYYSYIIVPKESSAQSLSDLRGKSFAFTDPISNTGKLSPTYILRKMGEDENTFFSNITYTYSHDKSIEAVAKKLVDGAAIDSLIWDYMNHVSPLYTSKTKIISTSMPYGIPPVVVPKELDNHLKEELRTILLHMHEDPEGQKILNNIMIDRFIEVSDAIYDSVRTMQQWVDNEK